MLENRFRLSDDEKNSILSSVDPMKAAVTFLFNDKDYYDWVGIYILSGENLVLGPYKGPATPHTIIPLSKGICGAAVREKKIINLGDVWSDKRFIACSSTTRSELVVPIWRGDDVIAEIDVDSNMPSAFSKGDEALVTTISELIANHVRL
ncbi:MAG: GAF domain-containing protein [Thermoplasmata archaeon]|nr:GAF domain-containing protein [Thermoplasmata archaeon]